MHLRYSKKEKFILPLNIMKGTIIIRPIPALNFAFQNQQDATMFVDSIENILKTLQHVDKIEPVVHD